MPALRKKHDVSVYRFDQRNTPAEVAFFPKLATGNDPALAEAAKLLDVAESSKTARIVWIVATVFLSVSILSLLAHFILGALVRGAEGESWAMLVTVVTLIFSVVIAAVADLRFPHVSPLVALGLREPDAHRTPAQVDAVATEEEATVIEPGAVDWRDQLAIRGTETRLGEAVRWLVERERGGPIASVIMISDGRNNAGLSDAVAAEIAKEASINVHTIGMGSVKQPQSVRVVDLEAPARVYPGDQFTLKGYVQAYGLEGRTATLSLTSKEDGPQDAAEIPEQSTRITLPASGEVHPIEFKITPDAIGKRIFELRISSPSGSTSTVSEDEEKQRRKTARIEIIDRKNKVLLLAGGPTREYRFLRNLLFRDKSTELDVYLQTAKLGVSQEADNLLEAFPDQPQQMFDYDCVVAFDPDWRKLNAVQTDLLERWVAEKAGGLVTVAGPVYTPLWAEARRAPAHIDTIKSLYPVVFFGRGAASLLGQTGSESVSPVKFSEEGAKASFLWLDDSPEATSKGWGEFEGVYAYYAVKEIKPGAKAYAYLDEVSDVRGSLPILFAGQFYGAGRVLYMGTGEMWRLRAVDDGYFERFYTKVIRYVSEGRLLRDSSRGVLIVGKQRCLLGETVTVRAALSDSQFKPLAVPQVSAVLIPPKGAPEEIVLRRIEQAARDGMYAGQFTALEEGDYRIELPVTAGEEEEVLRQSVRVRVPDLEVQSPRRNDALLSTMAAQTGGKYFVGVAAATGQDSVSAVWNSISAKDLTAFLPGTPDRAFQQRLMSWLLALIAGALSLEWLIRRLNKLA